jgi:transcriptional repressor NrdR
MTCPVCGAKTVVTNSRADNDNVRRRRECRECGYRFTTYEYEKEFTDHETHKQGRKKMGV